MGKSMAGNIPVAGGFGSALGGIPIPALAAAAAIGGLYLAGKSIVEISDKWEASQKNLAQATASIGGYYAGAQQEVNNFIATNRRFISSQSDVVDAYAALLRQGLGTKKAQDDLNLALDLSTLKHIGLSEAVTLLQQAEMGRGRALLPLGIQMKEFPILTESQHQADVKLEAAEKGVEKATLAHTAALKAHGPHSLQAQASAKLLADANAKLADAHSYAAQRAAASATVHDLLHQKLDGGRKSTSDLTQAQNELGNTWQSFAARTGPALNRALAEAVKSLTAMLITVLNIFNAVAGLIGKIGDLIGSVGRLGGAIANSGLVKTLGGIGSAVSALHIPGFAAGTDYVPQTMLAVVHQGEKIIPPGGRAGGGVTVNINIGQGAFIDGPSVDRLANTISQRLGYATGR